MRWRGMFVFGLPCAVLFGVTVFALSGCAPLKCHEEKLASVQSGYIEVCERRECRDALNGKFVPCPEPR